MNKPNQTELVLNYIREHGSITQIEALSECGVMRLPSRIYDIKRSGVNIKTDMVAVENRHGGKSIVARYSEVKNEHRAY